LLSSKRPPTTDHRPPISRPVVSRQSSVVG
jgi:hypothetical protein